MKEKVTKMLRKAHKIKNSISGIKNISEGILDRGEVSGDAREGIKAIQSAAEEAFSDIKELHAFQRDERRIGASSFSRTTSPRRIEIGTLAKEVIDRFRPEAEAKSQELSWEHFDENASVMGVKDHLREAMGNLIHNAIKYSATGGIIKLGLRRSNGKVRFSVSDNGPGLTESEIDSLFDPFRQGTAESCEDSMSMGLGLSIVKNVVNQHNGEIRADSKRERGSTFEIVLPEIQENRLK